MLFGDKTECMNIKLRIILFFSLAAFVSCESSNKVTPEINTRKEKYNFEIDSSKGEYYCVIDSVFLSFDKNYIIVDFVNYLTGKEAYNEAMKNGAYFIDGYDTIPDITDGYYISNTNLKLRKFRVNRNAYINILPKYNNHKPNILTSTKFFKTIESQSEYYRLLFIKYDKGIIYSIDEQFMP